MSEKITNSDVNEYLDSLNNRKNINAVDIQKDFELNLLTKYTIMKEHHPEFNNEQLCKSINSKPSEILRIKKDLGGNTKLKYLYPAKESNHLDPELFGEQYKNLRGKGISEDELICKQCSKK